MIETVSVSHKQERANPEHWRLGVNKSILRYETVSAGIGAWGRQGPPLYFIWGRRVSTLHGMQALDFYNEGFEEKYALEREDGRCEGARM